MIEGKCHITVNFTIVDLRTNLGYYLNRLFHFLCSPLYTNRWSCQHCLCINLHWQDLHNYLYSRRTRWCLRF